MPTRVLKVLLAVIGFGLLVSAVFGQRPAPDLVLLNGKVFTSNASQPYAEALAIRGEHIVAVGSSQGILALAGNETKRIDLGGRTVIPGINDAHDHLNVGPDTFDLQMKSNDPTWQEVKDAIVAAVAKAPKGTWITGATGAKLLDEPQATRATLDQLAPDHPVLLATWTGHAALLNTMALKRLGVGEDQRNPEGGMYVRNQTDGKLSGMVLEFARFRLGSRFSELATEQQAVKQLQDFFADAARLGITTVQDMAMPVTASRAVALLQKGPPPIRVRVIWFGLTNEKGPVQREGRVLPRNPVPGVTVSGTKWILDGTPIEHSAAMREPYADRPAWPGQLNFSQKEIEGILSDALQRNDQLMVHVAGDRAAEAFLSAMESTGGEKVWSQRRIRLEHGDGLLPDLVPRAKRLGVIVVQNPTHFTLGELFVQRFGEKRARALQPLRSLLDGGIRVAIGSDGPNNPYLNILLASTYGRNPSEAISREQAVTAYTLTSAYAEFAEKEKGSLEPDKLADLAVLSQDIFAISPGDLPKTESVLTLVGGKIVYDAKVLTLR